MPARPVLVTGAAGFIGMHVCERLAARGERVVGVDCLAPSAEPALQRARLDRLLALRDFTFEKIDLADAGATAALFARTEPDRVVHLAAQPGVRASIQDPIGCVRANCDGFVTVLEGARLQGARHVVFASSSSVYGANRTLPYAEDQRADHPVSLYAATKKANELMAHAYAHVHRLPVTGLRFFTVYGPWGRPDMAVFLFTRAILAGTPIRIFNRGHMRRDFTYVDDVVEGVLRTLDRPPGMRAIEKKDESTISSAPYRIYNIGNSRPVELLDLVGALEMVIGRPAIRDLTPPEPGDVPETFADIGALQRAVGFAPSTPLAEGLARFVDWYRSFHGHPAG